MSDKSTPYYHPVQEECRIFEHAFREKLPLLLKGPTGCGKSRLVEHMAAKLGLECLTVSCHDETSASDLLGRYLIRGNETIWQDGPLTQAVRQGSLIYLDELAEARPDTIVILHSLTDHRRILYLDRHHEVLQAPASFMLVASFNPGYQGGLKELKPSTRQRFICVSMNYPENNIEIEIIQAETDLDTKRATKLVQVGSKMRNLAELGINEGASTRLLVDAGKLMKAGLPERLSCEVGIIEPLTDDRDIAQALKDLVAMVF